jgi:hypothetical protein
MNKPSKKYSMDLSEENKEIIGKISDNMNMNTGPFINFLIKTICLMPDEIRKKYIGYSISMCQLNDEISEVASDCELKALEDENKYYLQIAQIINGGEKVYYSKDDNKMNKYKMKDGYLKIPKDWIVLNPESEGKYRFAGVVECRNHQKYGVPHFVFFTDVRYARDYDEDFTQKVYKKCEEKWGKFNEIRKKEVELKPDPINSFGYSNMREYLEAPLIGLFSILRDDDELFDGKPPYGAMIVSECE